MEFYRNPLVSMEFHAIGIPGNPWDSIESRGILWNFLCDSMGFHENQWTTMEFHAIPRNIEAFHGIPCDSMENPMEPDGIP